MCQGVVAAVVRASRSELRASCAHRRQALTDLSEDADVPQALRRLAVRSQTPQRDRGELIIPGAQDVWNLSYEPSRPQGMTALNPFGGGLHRREFLFLLGVVR